MGILFDLALPVFMLLLWIVCFIFKIESGFHWLPLVACAAFYLFAGLLLSNATVRTNKHSSSTMTTCTRTTTDEYVYEDGKIIVETEEERPAEVYNSSWVENHYCTRCKHKFSEKKSFSNTTRY